MTEAERLRLATIAATNGWNAAIDAVQYTLDQAEKEYGPMEDSELIRRLVNGIRRTA